MSRPRRGRGPKNINRVTPARALRHLSPQHGRKRRVRPNRSQQIQDDPHRASISPPGSRRSTMPAHFALEAKANSIDPMQADICGVALALAPNDACYVPISHKQSGENAGLFASGIAPDQITTEDLIEALRPCLKSPGILKIGFNIKFNAVMFAQHGVTICNHDDAQLMSYALDAGRNAHGLDALAERWLGHATLSYGEITGSGRAKLSFDQVAIDRATAYSAEDADVILRLWRVLKPRLLAERMTAVYETLERPLVSVLARMERRGISIDRQVLSRLSGEFAQTAARVEAEIQEIAGEPVNVGSPKQIGDIIFGKMGIAGRQQDQDRRMVDLGADPGRTGRTGARISEEDSGVAAGLEAEIDLHRRAADLCASANPSRSHDLRSRGNHHGAAVVERAQPAEHPGAHRGRPKDPPRLHRLSRPQAGFGGLLPDRIAAARGDRRYPRAEAGLPRRARHSRHDGVGNVRGAGKGYAGGGAPPRQGDQLRYHLWHLGVWPGQPARHPARRSLRLHQEILRALSRHPRLHGPDPRFLPRSTAMSKPCSAANAITRRSRPPTPRSARSTSAPRSTRGCRARPPTSSAAP